MVSFVQDKVTIRLRLWPRNKFETALRALIVSWGELMTARANCRRTFARTNIDLNTLVIGTEAGLLVDESRKTVTAV